MTNRTQNVCGKSYWRSDELMLFRLLKRFSGKLEVTLPDEVHVSTTRLLTVIPSAILKVFQPLHPSSTTCYWFLRSKSPSIFCCCNFQVPPFKNKKNKKIKIIFFPKENPVYIIISFFFFYNNEYTQKK